ncbi:MAG: hypothetical protein EZS28_008299 [Streblomastix strix]|uniref:Uncharacterized protein n=1 Tax=Streblomastix strix TaxID=222440 RepID=A0A5J4WM67_9EUKA|nr:MAG: hypothetical protein EZS28_008299 [Streblomastix strix]
MFPPLGIWAKRRALKSRYQKVLLKSTKRLCQKKKRQMIHEQQTHLHISVLKTQFIFFIYYLFRLCHVSSGLSPYAGALRVNKQTKSSYLFLKSSLRNVINIYIGKELTSSITKQFEKIEKHLFNLTIFAKPDYFMNAKLMKEAAVEKCLDLKQPLEWEIEMDNLHQDVKNQSKSDFTDILLMQNRLQVVERLISQSLMNQIIEETKVQQ